MFASPIAAMRLKKAANVLEEELVGNGPVDDLLDGFSRIMQNQVWKQPNGIKAVGDLLMQTNPFDTTTKPWNHQVCAHSFIYDKPAALLAMEMGTGKTLVAIQKILDVRPMKTLVVAPLAVCEVWPDEWMEHTGGKEYAIEVLDGAGTPKKVKQFEEASVLATATATPIIFIVNYESFWRPELARRILDANFDMIIYDEAHKLKTASGKASRFAARLAWKIPVRLGLTGTPLPNNPLDGYGLWRALDPSMFGTVFAHYKKLYAEFGGFEGRQVVGWRNMDRFKRLMDFLTYRVDIDVLDLPEATDTVRYVDMPASAKRVYNSLYKNFVADVEGGLVTASNALARLMKLREVTCGFVIDDYDDVRDIHSARQEAFAEYLEEIEGEKCVVFCEFKEDIDRVRAVCDKLGLAVGEVTGDNKDTDNHGGKFPPSLDVLACNTKAGGLGLNLVAARHACFYSVGFALADHLQARRRVHRGGQYRTVTYTHLVAPGTVDEAVYKALKNKQVVIDEILNSIKGGLHGTGPGHTGTLRGAGQGDQGARVEGEGAQEGA